MSEFDTATSRRLADSLARSICSTLIIRELLTGVEPRENALAKAA